ncbi:MAG: glycerophosphodiester phosphodiesterase [Pseudomonadales bacterium]
MTPRQRNWLLIFTALVLLVLGQRLAPRAQLESVYFDVAGPMVIAHQGGDGLRPSNTLLAFQHAVDLGVDVLEMDVHQTRDGALVLMHDATVDRTTDASGAVADLTLEQVKALDAAYRWPYDTLTPPYRGRGVRVPTLNEVIERFPQLRYNVEIKPESADTAKALCAQLTRLDAARRTLVASFHETALEAFRDACPAVATSAYRAEVSWFYVQYRLGFVGLARPRMAALQLPMRRDGYDFSDPEFIAATAQRVHLDFWTVNDVDDMRLLVARGAGGIITDRPDLLLEVLGRRSD